MKKQAKIFLLISSLLLLTSISYAEPQAPEWVDFYGNVTINGQPAAVGTKIEAYDPDSILCGEYIVGISGAANDSAGIYGLMHVYRDDITTPGVDEGANPGDTILFKINGQTATTSLVSGSLTWTSNGNQNEVNLAVTGVNVAFTVVDLPTDTIGAPGDTIRFQVGIRNDGNNLDFYGVTALSDTSTSSGWTAINNNDTSYANVGETTYVYFDIFMPVFGGGGDTTFTINYTVFSRVDTTVQYADSVLLIKSITDVNDDNWTVLPDGFSLGQNYPNPFNPTTTITFSLPYKTAVHLQIINMLGQLVDNKQLGIYSAGSYEIEYDASSLSSGVYFYRLITDKNALSRKMILLK